MAVLICNIVNKSIYCTSSCKCNVICDVVYVDSGINKFFIFEKRLQALMFEIIIHSVLLTIT